MVKRNKALEEMKQVLDVCCGSRMFWFDKKDNRAMFIDKRKETQQPNKRYAIPLAQGIKQTRLSASKERKEL